MRTLRLVPVALVVPASLVLGACGGSTASGQAAAPKGPAATFTASANTCSIETNGFTYKAGDIALRFTNNWTAPVTIELLGSDGSVKATAPQLAANRSSEQTVHLATGKYQSRCTDGKATWLSNGTGDSPSSVIISSIVPEFEVS